MSSFFQITVSTDKNLENIPQIDGLREANGSSCGPPSKLFPPLDAGDGSFYVFDPQFSLLHMRSLEEVILVLVCGNLENQLNRALLVSHTYSLFSVEILIEIRKYNNRYNCQFWKEII